MKADALLLLPAAEFWHHSAVSFRAPRPPAVNIKSALLRGREGPRPCRAERTPSLTRALLLSPGAVRAK